MSPIKKSFTKRLWGYGAMNLSRYEQETIVNCNAGEQAGSAVFIASSSLLMLESE